MKACCVSFYEGDLVSTVLGDNFHPGGDAMTRSLGMALGLDPSSRVLDVACGAGASAIAITREFGCHVVGVDLSEANLAKARTRARTEGLEGELEFRSMDAEELAFEDGTFDATIIECALCTFPDKERALAEMHRVLRPGGRVGITDVVIERELPPKLDTVLMQVACISGALSVVEYVAAMERAGFQEVSNEDHSGAIRQLLELGQRVVMAWGLAEKLYGIDLEKALGMDQAEAKELLEGAFRWLDEGAFGYGLFVGTRP
jgi:ubiquinone/menaquinone biosynthesis C-methylase UbiE